MSSPTRLGGPLTRSPRLGRRLLGARRNEKEGQSIQFAETGARGRHLCFRLARRCLLVRRCDAAVTEARVTSICARPPYRIPNWESSEREGEREREARRKSSVAGTAAATGYWFSITFLSFWLLFTSLCWIKRRGRSFACPWGDGGEAESESARVFRRFADTEAPLVH
ncbi:hypothetical protein B296_00013890 [Ensete ventricosum]|uniref:Uncharacterized protein n=1 Tax=Ensete ventricosum TaxID=4639 RepID=A0A427AXM3_ENSVE|nr:hypothetical protein B296_00013890 [Ensete ventricosum]